LKKISLLLITLMIVVLLLSSCKAKEKEEDKAKEAQNVKTAAAQTANAMLRTLAASTPTQPRPSVSPTVIQPTPTLPPTLTPLAGTPTQGLPPVGTGNVAEFILDVTVLDGSTFAPNTPFVKTWRLKNIGSNTWTTAYSVVFSSGTQMGAPNSAPLTTETPPGQTVDISVSMTAPADPGSYYAYFLLSDANGNRFGIGAAASPFYVQIQVAQTGGTQAPPVTPVVTTTPGAAGGTVNWVFLSVDSGSATGCPHTYSFTGMITLTGPARVTYQLELIPAVTGVQMAPPTTVDLPAGTHSVIYSISLPAAYNGIAILHVTSPEDVPSNQVQINLTC
jgi:hypothetical protein